MSARILIVDDMPVNLRLMQAQLAEEYYDVLLATSGQEALDICGREMIDLVLLDVMMPGMDGFEVCRRLKSDPRTMHLPVVLVTALDQQQDRVRGLEAGADDFLTKPVRGLPLFSRIRSLTRLKMLTDELRMRAETSTKLTAALQPAPPLDSGLKGRVYAILDAPDQSQRLARLIGTEHNLIVMSEPDAAVQPKETVDLFIIDLRSTGFDPLRLCSRLRSQEATRQIPILLLAAPEDEARVGRGLELGANDYCQTPLDKNELLARIRTQVRRRRYDEGLRRSFQSTLELAITDPLTGLHNRRFFDTHLRPLIDQSRQSGRPLCVMMLDIDHFKHINDAFGHDAGDEVLRQFAHRILANSRGSDLAARMGGEEFALLMPDLSEDEALQAADRLREVIAASPFGAGDKELPVTASFGLAMWAGEEPREFLKRADLALYQAKREGRNRVVRSTLTSMI
ncbi:PleD family two-component system response regulator [Aureimonas sp. N4]|uniref:PleD family two-component system response regulator n=1 Tax=Aureimonas sp. N4 TaxID=1638165 RepID=UPI000783D87F|nr:PleD family two-component system response regulator [Aureimonas sp. N4]